MSNGQLATVSSRGLGLQTRTSVRLAAGLLMAASPLALTQAMATPQATGNYVITPKLVGTGPATVTATTVMPAASSTTATAKTVTVTTGTISGSTAFNAFTDFSVGKSVAVNLVLPNGAKNLVNTVDNQVNINGTIYSTLTVNNGSVLGGHVFFVAPNGFVLGPDGSINVGALTVETSKASLANSNGALDVADFPTSGVLAGTVTLDGTGAIDIQGKINASGVNDSTSGDGSVSLLSANSVTVEAGAQINAGGAAPIAAFTALVAGASGISSASGVVNAPGGDVILTGGTTDIAGQVVADGLGSGAAAPVTVTATSLTVDATGSITARGDAAGTGAGAAITLTSTGDANIAGALKADAASTGAAGGVSITGTTVELTGSATATGGTGSSGDVSLTSTTGAAYVTGTLSASHTGSLTLTSAGSLTLYAASSLSEGYDVVLSAAGVLDAQNVLTVGRDYSVTGQTFADQTLHPMFGATNGRDFTVDRTSTTSFTPGSITTAPRNLSITSGGPMTVSQVLNAGGAISLTAAGALTVSPVLNEGTDIALTATGATLDVTTQQVAKRDYSVTANGFADQSLYPNLTSGRDFNIDYTNTDVFTVGTLPTAPRDLNVTTAGAFTLTGGTLTAVAGETFAIAGEMDVTATGKIDVDGVPSANAGSVTITTADFVLENGGIITALAGTGSGPVAGAVGITVADSQTVQLGDATATGDATIDGLITGGAITITDAANAKASLSVIPTTLLDEASTKGVLAGLLLGLVGAYDNGQGTTDVEFQSAANVHATGAITVTAHSTSEGSAPLINLLGASPTTVSVSYAEIQSNATVHVASGAQLSAGGALSLLAQNTGTLSAAALSYLDGTAGASVSAMADTISIGFAGVHANMNVDAGALLTAASITAASNNQDNFGVSATSYATKGATAGIAIAYKDTTTSATTNFFASTGAAATLNPAAAKTGAALSIQALDDTITDATSASTGTGPTIAGTILDNTVGLVQGASKAVWGRLLSSSPATDSALKSADGDGADSSGHYRLAATVAITESSGSADATLGNGASTPSSNYSTGDVVVAALENDLSVRSNAQAEVASDPKDGTTTGISGAVAYGDFNHSSLATIAPDTTVDANRIAVDAQTLQPISDDFLQVISDPSVTTVLAHLNPNLGVVNTILTSYANATSASTGLSLAGAVSLFDSTINTYAWVGAGAHLTTAAGAGTNWTAALQDGTTIGGTGPTAIPGGVAYVSAPSWSDGLVVDAYTEQSSIDVGGGFGIFDTLKSIFGLTKANGSTSVGGAYNGVDTDATTIAGVDAGANITAPTGLGVNALTDNQIVALAPSSGTGTGIGGSGMVSNLLVTNHTHAIISNDASVSTDNLSMEGQQTFEIINVAADYVSAGAAAVGIGAAVSTLNTDTTAQIGDATGDAGGVYGMAVTAPTATGIFHIDNVTIHADTDGYAAQAGIAGAASVGEPPAPASTDEMATDDGEEGADVVESGGFAAFWANVEKESSDSGSTPSFGLAGAGSVALSFSNADSTAQIQGLSASKTITISAYTTGGAVTTNVVARDNPTLVAGAGAGAKVAATNTSPNTVAIAGAVTVQEPNDHAVADITDAAIIGAGSTNVEGLVGGVAVSAALAASVNSAATTTGSTAFAGAVSVFIDTDHVDATVANSTITGLTGGSGRNTTVTAYDDSDIGVGGGAGFSAGKAGAGFAASYISVGDPSGGAAAVEANITNSTLSQLDATSVQAGDASVLVGLAAVGAAGGGTANEFTGSAVDIELSRDVLAQTDTSTSISSGAITVAANGLRQSALDNVLINNGSDTAGTTGYDFTGQTSTTGAVEDGSGDSLAVGSGKGALIVAASGQVAVGGKTVIGASFTGVDLTGSHKAIVDDSTLNAGTGGVTVHASDDALVVGLGVGIASGTSFTVTGSLTLMQESSTTLADVRDSSQLTGGLITLQATDAATLASLAGDFAKSTSGAAGDAAIAIMTAEGSASATAENSTLAASSNLAVSAADTGLLVNIAVAGAASSTSLAIEGAIVTNVVDQGALASLTSVTDTSGGAVNVGAGSSQTIWAGALAAGYSSSQIAAGVGVVTSVLGDDSDGERAKALIDGGTFTVSDLTVGSSADATINVAGVGIQFGNSSATGSIVTNVNRGDVTASIDDGAHVSAQDNVGVEASSADTARVIAGAVAIGKQAAGIGVSVVTNVLDGDTDASISGSGTQVTALATSSSDHLTVDTGALSSPVNLGDINDLVSPVSAGLTLATKTVTGVAVNAASTEQIDVASLSLGLAKQVGIAANIVTNVSGGTTSAIIDQAAINQAAGTIGSTQTVDVSASDNAYTADLVGSIAGGQTVGFAAAINTAGFDRTTDAHVTNATISANQTANVDSTSSQTVVGFTVGGAAGQVGAAASVTVATFGATTRAYASGGTATAGTLNVKATDTAGDNINTASIAFGSSVGVAGGFDVTQNDNMTFAGLGRSAVPTVSDSTISGETVDAGTTNVIADTEATWHLHTVGGSAGGEAGVAAMGGILLSADDTEAGVYGGTVQSSGSGGSRVAANKLTVQATDNIYGELISGTLSLSGSVGIGASIGVMLDSDSVGSTIDAANVEAGAINVNTFTSRNLGEILVTGAGGVDVGIGATVGVILVGGGEAGGYGEQAFDELLPTLGAVSSGASGIGGGTGNTTLTSNEQGLANNASGVSTPDSLADVTFSSVLTEVKNSTLIGSNVQVTNTVMTTTSQQDGALAVGGYVGVGGGVGYTALTDRITASIDPNSTVTAGTINVSALSENNGADAADVNAYVGSAGLVGIGAAVAVVDDNMVLNAQAGGALTGTSGAGDSLTVQATDSTSAATHTYNVAAGAAAAGAVVSVIAKDGSVEAQILPTTSAPQTTVTDFNTVNVDATASGSLTSLGIAAAGGLIGALNAAYVSSEDGVATDAMLGVGEYGAAAGGITVSALRIPDASAEADGLALGGDLAVGAAIATATVDSHAISQVASGATIEDGASLTVESFVERDTNSDDSAQATSRAGSGSLFVSANASVATAENNASIQAFVGPNVALGNGNLTIEAGRDSGEGASSTGIAVGGLLAAGAVVAEADVGGDTTAYLGSGVTSSDNLPAAIIGNLTIQAGKGNSTGILEGDYTNADTTSGSGALIAGSAAVSTTNDTTTVTAAVHGRATPSTAAPTETIASTGTIEINANYKINTESSSDSLQAALAGGSGSSAVQNVDGSINADIGSGVALEANGAFTVQGMLTATLNGSTNTGAGGVVNGNAGQSTGDVETAVAIDIGQGSKLVVLGDPNNSPAPMNLVVGDLIIGTETGTMTSGGVVEAPFVNSEVNANPQNSVTLENGVSLLGVGAISVGDYALETGNTSAEVSTYGGIGVAGGEADTYLNANNTVTLGSNVDIEAFGDVTLAAGQAGDGSFPTFLNATATTDVYNETAIPISIHYTAKADTNNNTRLVIGLGSNVESVGNVNLISADVAGQVSATGTGHNPYLSLANDILSIFGASISETDSEPNSSSSSQIKLDGTVEAGVLAKQLITIDPSGNVTYGGALAAIPSGLLLLDPALATPATTGTIDLYTSLEDQITLETAAANNPALTGDQQASAKAAVDGLTLVLNDVTMGSKPEVDIAALLAAAGTVTVKSQSLITDPGSNALLKATGGALISITDSDPNSILFTNALTIPWADALGGAVNFIGGASTPSGVTVTQIDKGVQPEISIVNSAGTGKPIIVTNGEIDNYGGLLNIENDQGDLATYASLNALQLQISVPNGAFVVPTLNGVFTAGSSPDSIWEVDQLIPLSPSGELIADVAADSLFNSNGAFNSNSLTAYLDGGVAGQRLGYSQDQYTSVSITNNQYVTQNNSTPADGTTSVNGIVTAPWVVIFATPIGNTTLNNSGSGGTSYRGSSFVFPTAPTETLNRNVSSSSAPAEPNSKIYAQSIIINASSINVDSAVTAGHSDNYSVDLNSPFLALQTALDQTLYNEHLLSSAPIDVSTLTSTVNSGDQLIDVKYNPSTQQYVLNNLQGSAGGFIELTGHIYNTSAAGASLNINNGYGVINVVNPTNVPVVINNIDAGSGSTAEVVITDFNKEYYSSSQGKYEPETQWFVEKLGQSPVVYDNLNNPGGGLSTAEISSSQALQYNPLAGQGYVWTQTWSTSRTVTLNGDSLSSTVSNWLAPSYSMGTGFFTETDQSNSNFYTTTLTGSGGSYYGVTNFLSGNFDLPNFSSYYVLPTVFARTATVTETSKVKADNPIAIDFVGSNTGSVTINSVGSVLIAGQVINPDGTTSITAGAGSSILETGGTLSAKTLNLTAGSIGAPGAPLTVTLPTTPTSAGTLSVHSEAGGVLLSVGGAANLATIEADNGDVEIDASLGIYQASSTPIIADNVTLNSAAGGVGTTNAPILIGATQQSSTAGQHGVLNASAQNDIDVEKTTGDLLLGTPEPNASNVLVGGVTSLLGNVTLVADHGNIANASTAFTVDAANQARLAAVWVTLNLENASAATAATIVPFENRVVAAYDRYWFIKQNATVTPAGSSVTVGLTPSQTLLFASPALLAASPSSAAATTKYNLLQQIVANSTITTAGGQDTVSLTATQDAVFKSEAAASLGVANPNASQISAYVSAQYESLKTTTASYVAAQYTGITTFVSTTFNNSPPTGVSADYTSYQRIVGNSTITNVAGSDQLALTSGQQTLFAPEVTAATGVVNPTNAEVAAFVLDQYEALKPTWQNQATAPVTGFYTFTPDWTYTLTASSNPTLYNSLTAGAGAWTPAQLANTINANALVPVANTNILTQHPNVTGKAVTLRAPNGQIGNNLALNITQADGTLSPDGGTLIISLANPTGLTVTDDALLAAAAPGDLVLNGPASAPTSISVALPHLVGLTATGAITATAAGNIYLGSNNAGALADINSDNGQVRLDFGGSITNAGPTCLSTALSCVPTVKSGFLIIEAAQGDIGTAAKPLTISLFNNSGSATPILDSARAAGNLYISEVLDSQATSHTEAANLNLGVIFAGSVLNLNAQDGAITAYDPALGIVYATPTLAMPGVVRIQGGSINLTAKNAIGGSGTTSLLAGPLQVQASGLLTATGSALYLLSPGAPLSLGAANIHGYSMLTGAGFAFDGAFQDYGGLGVTVSSAIYPTGSVIIAAAGSNPTTAAGSIIGDHGGDMISAPTITVGAGGVIEQTNPTTAGAITLKTTTGALTFGAGTTIEGGSLALTSAAAIAAGPSDTFLALIAPIPTTTTDAAFTAATSVTFGDSDTVQAATSIGVTGQNDILGANDSFTAGTSLTLTGSKGISGGTGDLLNAATGITAVAGTTAFGDKLKATTTGGLIAFTSTVGALSLGQTDALTAPTISLTAKGTFSEGSSDIFIAKTTDVSITGASMMFGSQDTLTAQRNVTVTALSTLTGGSGMALTANNGAITVSASDINLGQGVTAQAPLAVAFTATSGAVYLGGSENLHGQSVALTSKTGMTLGASATIVATTGTLKINGGAVNLGASDNLRAAGDLDVVGTSTITGAGLETLASTGGQINVIGQSVLFYGPLYATSTGAMTLTATSGMLQIGAGSNLDAYNSLYFGAPGGLTVGASTVITVGSTFGWTAYQPASFGASDRITVGGDVTGKSTTLTFASGANLTANGQINLTTTGGGMVLGALTSRIGGGAGITLTSASTIFGNGDGQTNLTTSGSTGVVMTAGGDIGSSGLAVSMKTTALTATGHGNMWLKTISNLLTRKTTAPGVITINGQKVASN